VVVGILHLAPGAALLLELAHGSGLRVHRLGDGVDHKLVLGLVLGIGLGQFRSPIAADGPLVVVQLGGLGLGLGLGLRDFAIAASASSRSALDSQIQMRIPVVNGMRSRLHVSRAPLVRLPSQRDLALARRLPLGEGAEGARVHALVCVVDIVTGGKGDGTAAHAPPQLVRCPTYGGHIGAARAK
jgi:hypothetical protein